MEAPKRRIDRARRGRLELRESREARRFARELLMTIFGNSGAAALGEGVSRGLWHIIGTYE